MLEAITKTLGYAQLHTQHKHSDRNQQMSSHAPAAPKPAGAGLSDRQRAGTLTLFRLISTCLSRI